MPGSESSYGAYLEARERDGLRRGLTAIEARDARTIRIGKESLRQFRRQRLSRLALSPGADQSGGSVGGRAWRRLRRLAARHRQSRSVRRYRGQGRGAEAEAGGARHGVWLSGQCLGATGAVRPERARRRASRVLRPAQSREHPFRLRRVRRARRSAIAIATPPISVRF